MYTSVMTDLVLCVDSVLRVKLIAGNQVKWCNM